MHRVATLPCNLSLVSCFAGINVSQGSVATYAMCGGIFNTQLTTNLQMNLPVKMVKIGRHLTELWSRVCSPTFRLTLYTRISTGTHYE